MYEEPYRWVEAVGNRRQYLDEQFKQGSPVVALSYSDGVLLLTLSRGTPKLYEIYDRIGLGGMGHPADLEKLRFNLLEMAHLEGFNRSPSDVTAARLMKYGLAPQIKQAFEEIFKAPLIVKMLLAELNLRPSKDQAPVDTFLTGNYDGGFEETTGAAVLAATLAIQGQMMRYLRGDAPTSESTRSLPEAVGLALRTWAVGSLAQRDDGTSEENRMSPPSENRSERGHERPQAPQGERSLDELWGHLRESLLQKQLEAAVLERHAPGSSKYRPLKTDELPLPEPLHPS